MDKLKSQDFTEPSFTFESSNDMYNAVNKFKSIDVGPYKFANSIFGGARNNFYGSLELKKNDDKLSLLEPSLLKRLGELYI